MLSEELGLDLLVEGRAMLGGICQWLTESLGCENRNLLNASPLCNRTVNSYESILQPEVFSRIDDIHRGICHEANHSLFSRDCSSYRGKRTITAAEFEKQIAVVMMNIETHSRC